MSGNPKNDESPLSDAEIAKRRDEVIRRMANTPPKPKNQNDKKPPKRERRVTSTESL